MFKLKILVFFIILILFGSCSKEVKKSIIKEKSLELQVQEAYKEGMEALE